MPPRGGALWRRRSRGSMSPPLALFAAFAALSSPAVRSGVVQRSAARV
jgi:hypothetical protein